MRPIAILLGILASVATILTYLHLDPPWIKEYLPRIAWPSGQSDQNPPANSTHFSEQYANGYAQARKHDFSMAVEYYKAAVAAPDASEAQRAKAYDALGYAYYRAGDYNNAEGALKSALQIDPNATTARVNLIKVMCGEKLEPSSIAAALSGLRTTTSGDPYATRVVETDKELFAKCGYAAISAQ